MNSPVFSVSDQLPTPTLHGVGVGLRTPHYRHFLDNKVDVDWLEVHSENYFGDGGFDLFVLEKLAQDYPISLHGVGLALGSANGISEVHLAKLKRLVDRIQPALISEHLSWGSVSGRHLNDLLPMPLSQESLHLMCERVHSLQEYLKRSILIENVSSYVRFEADQMLEAEFLCELSRRTGCGILLDVNNVFVNQFNHGEDAQAELAHYRQQANSVQEIHLAGHSQIDACLIDDHGSRVKAEVWKLYEQVCQQISPQIPSLIEWDTAVPEIEILLQEVCKAREIQKKYQEVKHV